MLFSISAILAMAASTVLAAPAGIPEVPLETRQACGTILDPSFESPSSIGYPYVFLKGVPADTAIIAQGGAHTGTGSFNYTAGAVASDAWFCQSIQFCGNGNYRLSAWAKKSGTSDAYISFQSSTTIWPTKPVTNTWQLYSQDFPWNSGAIRRAICIDFSAGAVGQSIAVDDLAIVAI